MSIGSIVLIVREWLTGKPKPEKVWKDTRERQLECGGFFWNYRRAKGTNKERESLEKIPEKGNWSVAKGTNKELCLYLRRTLKELLIRWKKLICKYV